VEAKITEQQIKDLFLSHLGGVEVAMDCIKAIQLFLSHLGGVEGGAIT